MTPAPTELPRWGDIDCLGGPGPDDAIALLLFAGGMQLASTSGEGCPKLDDDLGPLAWGNVNCIGGIDIADVIAILAHYAGLEYAHAVGCPDIGRPVQMN